jgi:hypothetical protein
VRILFVTPNASGSGEAITAARMAQPLARRGHDVRFFAHPFVLPFLAALPANLIAPFAEDAVETAARWQRLLQEFRPHAAVFADYPLLLLSPNGRAILEPRNWDLLDDLDATLVTLDHLGLSQGPFTLPFGPPHLELVPQEFPAPPARMKILLPCPIQSPAPNARMRGDRFRYWQVPLAIGAEARQAVRNRFLRSRDEAIVFHSIPSWALEFCRRHSLPNHAYWTRIFASLFRDPPRPVTIVSVNNGSLLGASPVPGVRAINVGSLTPEEYDQLLLSSDLMLSDNGISVSLGKAVCGLVPCVALRNSDRLLRIVERGGDAAAIALDMEHERAGSVFPFEVFPIWSRADVETLGVFAGNSLVDCVVTCELFGGDASRQTIRELLEDDDRRRQLQSRQASYIDAVGRLPTAHEALLAALPISHGKA